MATISTYSDDGASATRLQNDGLCGGDPVVIPQEYDAFVAVHDRGSSEETVVVRIVGRVARLRGDLSGRTVQQQKRHLVTLTRDDDRPLHESRRPPASQRHE